MMEIALGRIGRGDLAIDAQGFDPLGEFGVIRDDRAAIAVTAQRLGREEAGRGNIGPVGRVLAVQRTAIALRRVSDQIQAELVADCLDFGVVGGLSEQVDGDHDFRRQLALGFHGLNLLAQMCRVHVVGLWQNVDEDRRSTKPRHDLSRRDEGEGWAENGVAGLQFPRHQREREGVCAIGAADGMRSATPGRKLVFQLGDFGAKDVSPAFHHALNGRIDFGFDALALCLKVNEGDGHEEPACSAI